MQIYRNNMKNRFFGKEAPRNSDAERATIALGQGASEHRNSWVKPTLPKTDSSCCFGIIFCDNHILVVSKRAGLSTQPHGSQDSLTDLAKAWIKKKYQKPGNVFLEPVHRLDTPVSGLVLFARTSKALSRLQEMMRQRQIAKTYFAWVEGHLEPPSGTLEHLLVHGEHRAFVAQTSHAEAKPARLHYRTLRQAQDRSLMEIDLETGRYHQIRAQFAAIHHPIIGDAKYGSLHRWEEEGILLHHGRLRLTHPVTKEPLLFENLHKNIY